MYAFNYHRPNSLNEASKLAGSLDEGKIIAGGMTLLPTMKQRLAAPSDLVALDKIDDLRGIAVKDGVVSIGAMTRHVEVATSAEIKKALPALAELAGMIGDPAVRNRGTIGGSIANNDPAADYPSACLALGATIHTTKRDIKADDYFLGLFETALEPGEIITKISFPVADKANYQKFRHPASRYALTGVFVAQKAGKVRVAVTGAGENGVFRATSLEQALEAQFSPAALEGKSLSAEGLNTDIHADAAYRAHLIVVLAKRAVAAAQ
jgi:aerobic carbon-monoxide dehydrogenase medium subunit